MPDARDARHPVIVWLESEGRSILQPAGFLDAFAAKLRAAGVDVARITTGVPTLHPQLFSWSGLWELERGASERYYRDDRDSDAKLQNSPINIAYEGRGPVRCNPRLPPEPGEFGILADLRSMGMTDYLVLPVPFSDGSDKALSLATRRPGGFDDADIALFAAAMPAFAAILEVQALRRTTRTLLDTYVGREAAQRVLAGQIRRGMGETIRAAIWLCDIRGFTALTESLPRDTLLAMLDQFFGTMCDAVEAHGGEVLKFMGDAMLAIFPFSSGDKMEACRRALAAAREAEQSLARINARRGADDETAIAYGIALHVGEVIYGNIGGESRLDFTVIGPAVNLAARIEAMCRELGRTLVLSADFVAVGAIDAEPLGEFSLRGVAVPQRLYAPRA